MGKLINNLKKQLKDPQHKKDAGDCIKLYNWLKSTSDGRVWSSQWSPLVDIKFKGFPSDGRTYKPNSIGYAVLKGIETNL